MRATTEFESKVSKGRITVPPNLPDGTYKLVLNEDSSTNCVVKAKTDCDEFLLIPASELSTSDSWYREHRSRTEAEKEFKKFIKEAMKKGLKDFYRPRYDPSLADDGNISFVQGEKPAVGYSYSWWVCKAEAFNPKRGSRLGTKTEYIAFLAVLIKKLVDDGWNVADAWYAVCNNSKELGHYRNSQNAKHDFENTGCNGICGFYDLANTYKILAEDDEAGGFWLAGGYYASHSGNFPLASLYHYYIRNYDYYCSCVGWLVLER